MKQKKDSFQQKIFQEIEKNIGYNNMITVPQIILKFCGDLESSVFLSQLIYWCDKGKSPDGFIFKSAKELYEETGLSEYKIKKCANKFISMGVIEAKKAMANGSNTWHYKLKRGTFLDMLIKFLKKEPKIIKKPTLNFSDSITEPTAEPKTELIYKGTINKINCPIAYQVYEKNYQLNDELSEALSQEQKKYLNECFEQFWSLYPLKVAKKYAKICFEKIDLSNGTFEKILSSIPEQKKTGCLKDPKYTPNPSTWLNQGRWDDEPPVKKDPFANLDIVN